MNQDFLSNFSLRFDFYHSKISLDLDINTKNRLMAFQINEMDHDIEKSVFKQFNDILSSKSDFFISLEKQIEYCDDLKLRSLYFLIFEEVKNSIDLQKLSLFDGHSLYCRCFAVTDKMIGDAIKKHEIYDMRTLTNATNAGAGCASCIKDIIDDFKLHLYVDTIEVEESSICQISNKLNKIQVKDQQLWPSEFLEKYLFDLERINILSLVDDHLYLGELDEHPETSKQLKKLEEICESANIRIFHS